MIVTDVHAMTEFVTPERIPNSVFQRLANPQARSSLENLHGAESTHWDSERRRCHRDSRASQSEWTGGCTRGFALSSASGEHDYPLG